MMFSAKTCYTCLKAESKEMVDLYKNDIDKIPYIDKLITCLSKKLQVTSVMEMCWPCIKQLRISYHFIDMVRATQHSLKVCTDKPAGVSSNTSEVKDEVNVYLGNAYKHDTVTTTSFDNKSEPIKNEATDDVWYDSDSSDYFLADLRHDDLTASDDLYSTCKECNKTQVTSTKHVCQNVADVKRKEIEVSVATVKTRCKENKVQKTTKKVRNRPSKYMKRPKPEVSYSCDHCDLTFNKRWKLQKHSARVHVQDKKYVCTYCDRAFKQSYHLREHITSHTGERNYSCTICDKTFQRISSQRRHIRSHEAAPGQKTKRTPFLCTICGKSFPFSNGVQRHMRIHLGIKSHECHLCKRKFTQSTHLHVHMRTHTGEKPYVCDTCGEAFSLNASLQKHMGVHQGASRNFVEDLTRVFLVQDTR